MEKPSRTLKFDEIGIWSELKLSILEEYAKPFNQILKKKRLHPIYIDAFAGAGHHVSKNTGQVVKGSPVRALEVQPPFDMLHLIDMDGARSQELTRLSKGRENVWVYSGDANKILLESVFPKIRYEHYERGLCILDPYGLDLDWEIIKAAGKSRAVEIFLNFPVMDMNRNVLWHEHDKVSAVQRERMTRFWGDDSWLAAAYSTESNLFGDPEKVSNDEVAAAFHRRLKENAGFKFVPRPIPMRNTQGATVYYLFFAALVPVAAKIVKDIFGKYDRSGEH